MERAWAERIIKQKVQKAFPVIYAIIIKIIVSLIISWMLERRSYKFNKDVENIYKYLQ